MEGYEAVSFDDEQVGTVVGRDGLFLIVEHGTIFKHRRPVPERFATVDDDAHVVRLTVSKQILETAPELEDGAVDERAAAAHYGLAEGEAAPGTLGYGRVTPDDPGVPAAVEELERGGVPADAERAALIGRTGPGQGANDASPPSPGVTGGDRARDFDRSTGD